MDPKGYYQALAINENASPDEIKSSYRKAALKYHPDRNPGDKSAEEKFKKASEAYSILGDPEKREQYDRFGSVSTPTSGSPFDASIFEDFADILGDFFGFGDFTGGRGRDRGTRTSPRRGSDLRYDLTLTFEDAYRGKDVVIKVPRRENCQSCNGSGSSSGKRGTCSTCHGSGSIIFRQGFFSISRTCSHCSGTGSVIIDPCKECHGEGYVKKPGNISIHIPKGVDNGFRIRVAGEGEAGVFGGPRGDLYLFITVNDHSFFHREGEHLFCEISVSIAQAVLGGLVEINTLDGAERLKIPPGTQSESEFRIKGRGVPIINKSTRGDLYVKVKVAIPTRLTKEQKKIMEDWTKVESPVEEEKDGFVKRLKDLFS